MVGFVGRVEYRHVASQSGGAQYGRGVGEAADLLTVFAEAFDRDADPADFSLRAMIAHERGHQLFARHPRVSARVAGMPAAAEEVMASVLGALVLGPGTDCDVLLGKATAELLDRGNPPDDAVQLIQNLWDLFGRLL